MGSRSSYGFVQRIINSVNQLNKSSEDWFGSEALYTRIYMERIRERLSAFSGPLQVLDGGCGTGHMAIPLAQDGHSVIGIEVHKSSLEVLDGSAKKAGVSIDVRQGDLLDRLKEVPSSSVDAALCIGVLYTCANFREIVGHFGRVLKPGGLLFASFRPPYYFIAALLRRGQFAKALSISETSEGMLRLAQTPAYYNWQKESEVAELYETSGLDLVEQRPVGIYSGAGYDGTAALIDVEQVDERDMQLLYELEKGATEVRGAGRFSLAIGKKT